MSKSKMMKNVIELIKHDLDVSFDKLEPRDYRDLGFDEETSLEVYEAFVNFLDKLKVKDLKKQTKK